MTSMEVCEALGFLRGYPRQAQAVAAIAEIVEEHVPPERYDDLLRAMRRYDDWIGPATFEAECRALGDKPKSLPEFVGYAKPQDVCPLCSSWGHVRRADGLFHPCTCTNGQQIEEDWLHELNRRILAVKAARGQSADVQAVTKTDVDRIFGRAGKDVTDQNILEIIERICGDDFCEALEMRMAMDADEDHQLRVAADKLAKIYRIAHSSVLSHTCYDVHGDWRREAESLSAKLAVAR